jgi:hypothetical protein
MVDMTHRPGLTGVESGHIKSRDRVRDLGEVYTQPREVQAMLDLIPDSFVDIDTKFLEPAAGNGNFLVAILERKIAAIDEATHGGTEFWYEFALLRCLASIYGVDISDENVMEAHERMGEIVDAALAFSDQPQSGAFERATDALLASNVVLGDSLNSATEIMLVEYTPLTGERFARQPSPLEEPPGLFAQLYARDPLPTIHYTELRAS